MRRAGSARMEASAPPVHRVPWVMVQASSGPVLYRLHFLPGCQLQDGVMTGNTGTCRGFTHPSLPVSGGYQHEILDYSCKDRAAAPDTQYPHPKDVQWEMVAEFPRIPLSNPPDITPSYVTGTPKEQALDLSTHQPMPVLVKEETAELADDSLDGPPVLHHHDSPPLLPHLPHSLGSAATTTGHPITHRPPRCDLTDHSGRLVSNHRQPSSADLRTQPFSLPLLTKTEAADFAEEPMESPPVLPPVSSSPLPPPDQRRHRHPLPRGPCPPRCVSPSTATSVYYQQHLLASGVRNIAGQCAADVSNGGVLDLRTPQPCWPVCVSGESSVSTKDSPESHSCLHLHIASRLPHHNPYACRQSVSSSTVSRHSDRDQSALCAVVVSNTTPCLQQGELLDLRTRRSTPPAPVSVNPTHCVQEPPSAHQHLSHPPPIHPSPPAPPPPPPPPSPPLSPHHNGPRQTHPVSPSFSQDPNRHESENQILCGNHSQKDREQNYSPISSASTETCPEERIEEVEEEIEEEVEGEEEREGEEWSEPRLSNTSAFADEKPKRVGKKPGRKKGQVSRVLHLWEFILDLLRDPRHCPRIIHWENEAEGVFRVLQSSEVARLWGEKKRNKKVMTYEKLSRSLRYSRKEGFFDSLPKGHSYPKKLCFKFGPRSYGWRSDAC